MKLPHAGFAHVVAIIILPTALPLRHDRPRTRPFSGPFAPPSVEDAAADLLLWPLPRQLTLLLLLLIFYFTVYKRNYTADPRQKICLKKAS